MCPRDVCDTADAASTWGVFIPCFTAQPSEEGAALEHFSIELFLFSLIFPVPHSPAAGEPPWSLPPGLWLVWSCFSLQSPNLIKRLAQVFLG